MELLHLPSNLLLFIYAECIFVISPISVGIIPVKLLSLIAKKAAPTNCPTSVGRVPLSIYSTLK